jgi:hypothetical protein
MHVGYWWESQKETTRKTWMYVGDNIEIDLGQDGVLWTGLI